MVLVVEAEKRLELVDSRAEVVVDADEAFGGFELVEEICGVD